MIANHFNEIREDCLLAIASQSEVRNSFGLQRIAVTGGTGFLGSWIAETVAALNDEYHLGITLDLYARNIHHWAEKYPHLSKRSDIQLKSQDVRSPFEFNPNTNFIVHAAGLPNNRVHASDPLRVFQTTVSGIGNVLEAASKLDNLTRFVNVSSCLVAGQPDRSGPLCEKNFFPMPCGQLHMVYAAAKRAAEDLAVIYRSQFRMPISTVRPFTFVGPYQELDRPWALNCFLRDAFTRNDIRIHGDGGARRSYLFGSDAAWWILAALSNGKDGAIYNIGSSQTVTHLELVKLIGRLKKFEFHITLNTAPQKQSKSEDLYPDIAETMKYLGVSQSCNLENAIDKALRWYSETL